jgi:hypothetical protein
MKMKMMMLNNTEPSIKNAWSVSDALRILLNFNMLVSLFVLLCYVWYSLCFYVKLVYRLLDFRKENVSKLTLLKVRNL